MNERELTSWSNPARRIRGGRVCHQDLLESLITFPADISPSAIFSKVEEVVKPIFEAFSGFEVSPEAVEDLTRLLIERKL